MKPPRFDLSVEEISGANQSSWIERGTNQVWSSEPLMQFSQTLQELVPDVVGGLCVWKPGGKIPACS